MKKSGLIQRLTAFVLYVAYIMSLSCGYAEQGSGFGTGLPVSGTGGRRTEFGLSRTKPVAADSCFSDSTFSDEVLVSASERIGKDGGTVSLYGARIEVPVDALESETEITICRIHSAPETGESIKNAVPGSGGFRFLPKGTRFKKPAQVTIPYNPVLNENPLALEELYTYFYDTKLKNWIRLDRVGIDPTNCTVTSVTTHFTDMITATLSMPESPAPCDVSLNSIKKLDAVRADGHIIPFMPPSADSSGAAHFSFKLEVPLGRRGMQPELCVSYSSEGANGIMGGGFSLGGISQITTDTRNGIPRYNTKDSYMKDGVLLQEESRTGTTIVYSAKKEREFEKICRIGSGTETDFWEVTAKNGTVRRYGAYRTTEDLQDESARCGNAKNTFSWYITEEVDVHGNTVTYEYEKQDGFVYPAKISWTGYKGKAGPYFAKFLYDSETRRDIQTDCRSGSVIQCRRLLKSIQTGYGQKVLRSYDFTYKEDLYAKMHITEFCVQNSAGESYSWQFEYEDFERDSGGNLTFFAAPEKWHGDQPLSLGKSETVGETFTASAGVGYGLPVVDVRASGGVSGEVSRSERYAEELLIDINGDGRPDALRRASDGSYLWAENTGSGFSDERSLSVSAGDFEREVSTDSSVSWNVYGGAGVKAKSVSVGLGAGYSESHQESTSSVRSSLMDVDGDGLCDIIESGKPYYLKNNGNMTFTKMALYTKVPVSEVVQPLSEEESAQYRKTYFVQTPFRMWRAPFSGTVQIKEKAERLGTAKNTVSALTFIGDGKAEEVLSFAVPGSRKKETALSSGQKLYFITDSGVEPRGTDVKWNIALNYTSVMPFSDCTVRLLDGVLYPTVFSEEDFYEWLSEIRSSAPEEPSKTADYYRNFACMFVYDSAKKRYVLQFDTTSAAAQKSLRSFFAAYPVPQKTLESALKAACAYGCVPQKSAFKEEDVRFCRNANFFGDTRAFDAPGTEFLYNDKAFLTVGRFCTDGTEEKLLFLNKTDDVLCVLSDDGTFCAAEKLSVLGVDQTRQDSSETQKTLTVRFAVKNQDNSASESIITATFSSYCIKNNSLNAYDTVPVSVLRCFLVQDGLFTLDPWWQNELSEGEFKSDERSADFASYKEYKNCFDSLSQFLKESAFCKYRAVTWQQEFLPETSYSLSYSGDGAASFSAAVLLEGGLIADKEFEFSERLVFNSAEDFSLEDFTHTSPIFSYQKEEELLTSDGTTETVLVTEDILVPSDEFLYGGSCGWYYGVWKGALSDVPFSEKKLEEFMADSSDVQSKEDFSALKNKTSQSSSKNPSDSAACDSVHFYLPQCMEEAKNEDVSYKVDFSKALCGAVSGTAQSGQYFPFITVDVIHSDRAGGQGYYSIDGLYSQESGSQVSVSGGGSLSVPVLRKTYTSGLDKTPNISLSVGGTASRTIDSGVLAEKTVRVMEEVATGSFSKGENESVSKTRQAFADMNGDGIADIIQISDGVMTVTRAEKSSCSGELTYSETSEFSGISVFSQQETELDVYGGSVSPGGNIAVRPSGLRRVDVEQKPSSFPSGGMSYSSGESVQSKGFLDINGDGLPDFYDGNTYRLGTGCDFVNLGLFSDAGVQTKQKVETVGTNISIGTGASLSEAKSLSTGASVGLGATYSGSSTVIKKMMADLNGDGLPDILEMQPGSTKISVRYNTGSGFLDAQSVNLPGWGSLITENALCFLGNADSSGFDLPLIKEIPLFGEAVGKSLSALTVNPSGVHAVDFANSLDWTSSCSLGVSGSAGVNVNVGINIVVFCVYIGTINITAAAGAGVDYSTTITGATVRLIDMDGDGLVDHVLRIPGRGTYWKRNVTGRVGLLRSIITPQGAQYSLSYSERYGTPSDPHFMYVMSALTVHDGCGVRLPEMSHGAHEITQKFTYKNSYFDRAQKERYGFSSVTTTFSDGTCLTQTYENSRYYSAGTLTSSVMHSPDGFIFERTEFSLTDEPVCLVKSERNFSFEQKSGTAAVRTERNYSYDQFGNCVTFIEDFGNGVARTARICYAAPNMARYIVSLVADFSVCDSSGIILRHREGFYDDFGNLTELRQETRPGVFSSDFFAYDEYGALCRITDSRGATCDISYDEEVHQFPVSTRRYGKDTDVYTTFAEYDSETQKKTYEQDENGSVLRYGYDDWQRLSYLRTSYDTGAAPAKSFSYHTPKNALWYAVTRNKLIFDADDDAVITTVCALDGLSRTMFTAKTGVVFADGVKKIGWNVSGGVLYDSKFRPCAEYMPYFVQGELKDLVLLCQKTPALGLCTKYEYDHKDRKTTTILPDESVVKNDFFVAQNALVTRTTDPLGTVFEKTVSAQGGITSISRYSETGERLTSAKYAYDGMNQMIFASDAAFTGELTANSSDSPHVISVTYDMLGRKTSLKSADGGLTEFTYDAAGNLATETTAVLREQGERITYDYDGLNRLTRVHYPDMPDAVYEYGTASDKARHSANRLRSVTDESGTVFYEYGLLGEVTKETRTLYTHLNSIRPEETATTEYRTDYLGRMQHITYPDGETVSYGYDEGGQVVSVTGTHYGMDFPYVTEIGYNEHGQRTYIAYGNGVQTEYSYAPARLWLSGIRTQNANAQVLQNITYDFDRAGNVLGYVNDCLTGGGYRTEQHYEYDDLYQLTAVSGKIVQNPYNSLLPEYVSDYTQSFNFDKVGNMITKSSKHMVSPVRTVGDELNYALDYHYDETFAHRITRAGNRYYKYDSNGNVTAEQDGAFEEASPAYVRTVTQHAEDVYGVNEGWGITSSDAASKTAMRNSLTTNRRTYTWDSKNRLKTSSDSSYSVAYLYAHDGNRTNKYTQSGETLYFNKFWTHRTDSGNRAYGGQTAKHIFLGDTRLVTKLNSGNSPSYQEELNKQYFYHTDHLGSATVITDRNGAEYQHTEYTPYGETWAEVTHNTGADFVPYKFTAQEKDSETGLYYYGVRYLDPKTAHWLSCDPALSEYIGNSSAGEGGMFNTVNMHLYHYAGNNPVKYVDPDGNEIKNSGNIFMQDSKKSLGSSNKEAIAEYGCTLTSYTRMAIALGADISLDDANKIAVENSLFTGDNLLTVENGATLVNCILKDKKITDVSVLYESSSYGEKSSYSSYTEHSNSSNEYFCNARIETSDRDNTKMYGHTVSVDANALMSDRCDGRITNMKIRDTSSVQRDQLKGDSANRVNYLERLDFFKINRIQNSIEGN